MCECSCRRSENHALVLRTLLTSSLTEHDYACSVTKWRVRDRIITALLFAVPSVLCIWLALGSGYLEGPIRYVLALPAGIIGAIGLDLAGLSIKTLFDRESPRE
jgi:hypothetical protein